MVDLGGEAAPRVRAALHASPGQGSSVPFRTAAASPNGPVLSGSLTKAAFLKPSPQRPQEAWCHPTRTLPVTAESPKCWSSAGREPRVLVYRRRLPGLGPAKAQVARSPGGVRGPRLKSSDVRPGE